MCTYKHTRISVVWFAVLPARVCRFAVTAAATTTTAAAAALGRCTRWRSARVQLSRAGRFGRSVAVGRLVIVWCAALLCSGCYVARACVLETLVHTRASDIMHTYSQTYGHNRTMTARVFMENKHTHSHSHSHDTAPHGTGLAKANERDKCAVHYIEYTACITYNICYTYSSTQFRKFRATELGEYGSKVTPCICSAQALPLCNLQTITIHHPPTKKSGMCGMHMESRFAESERERGGAHSV